MLVCVRVRTSVRVCVSVCVCVHVSVHMCVCVSVCVFVHVYVCVGCVPVSVCAVCVCDMYVFVMCVFVLCGSFDVYLCVLDGAHLCTFSVLGLLVLEHAGVELCVVVETSAGQCG